MIKVHVSFSSHPKAKVSRPLHPGTSRAQPWDFLIWNLSPKKPKSWHRCRHFKEYSVARKHFRDVILSKRFCSWLLTSHLLPLYVMAEPYYFKPNVLQTPERVKRIVSWKRHFADLVRDAKAVVGFSASHQFQVGWNDVTKLWPSC